MNVRFVDMVVFTPICGAIIQVVLMAVIETFAKRRLIIRQRNELTKTRQAARPCIVIPERDITRLYGAIPGVIL